MKVLMLSYHLAPGEAAGATRPTGLAKTLIDLGHEVVVFTAEPDAERSGLPAVVIADVGLARVVKRAVGGAGDESVATLVGGQSSTVRHVSEAMVRFAKSLIAHPDEKGGWGRAVLRAVTENPGLSDFDWVIATGPPFTTFVTGVRIASVLEARLLLDYRDLWTGSAYYPYGSLRRAIDRWRERKALHRATVVTATTNTFAELLKSQFPSAAEPYAIYTGVDVDSWQLARDDSGVRPVLRLAHFGSLYEGRRDITPLAAALSSMRSCSTTPGFTASVRMYGRRDGSSEAAFTRAGVSDLVSYEGVIARERVASELAETDVAVLIVWDNQADCGSLPSKVFEYLAAEVHILVIGARPGSETHDFLRRFNGVSMCMSTDEVINALRAVWSDVADGVRPRYSREAELSDLSLRAMGESFELLMNEGHDNEA